MVKTSMFDGEPMVKSLFSYSFSHVSIVFRVSSRNKKFKLDNYTTILPLPPLYHPLYHSIVIHCPMIPRFSYGFSHGKCSPGFLPRPCRHPGGLWRQPAAGPAAPLPAAAAGGDLEVWGAGVTMEKSWFYHGFTMV